MAKEKKEDTLVTTDEFEKFVTKSFKNGVGVGTMPNEGRWNTRNYAINKAIGGGVPSSRITTIVGESSSGKTTATLKVAAEVASTHRETGERCDPMDTESCNVLFIDQEGHLDEAWAKIHGYHPNEGGNKVMSFPRGEDAIDTINAAIQSRLFSLIILDSIDLVVCQEENDKSASDLVVGKKAIMMNRAFRAWSVALVAEGKSMDKWWQRPTLMCTNQIRHGIGNMAPESYPGGRAQYYMSSIFIRMGKANYNNTSDRKKPLTHGIYKGYVKKNKTAEPNTPIQFDMILGDVEGLGIGAIDNASAIYQDAKRFLISQDSGGYDFFGTNYRIKTDLQDYINSSEEAEIEVMNKIIANIPVED